MLLEGSSVSSEELPTLLIGIPTIKRNGEEYLSDTMQYLLNDLDHFTENFSNVINIKVLLYVGGTSYLKIKIA